MNEFIKKITLNEKQKNTAVFNSEKAKIGDISQVKDKSELVHVSSVKLLLGSLKGLYKNRFI